MKRGNSFYTANGKVLLPLIALISSMTSPPVYGDTLVSSEGLAEDFSIMRNAFESLHPGLYRYNTQEQLDAQWQALQNDFNRPRSSRDIYLSISRFTASIRCGHTYANYLNQTDAIKEEVFNRPDKLPFAFKLVDRRMLVTKDASEHQAIGSGAEVVAIDGKSVSDILDALIQHVKADGSNDTKRLHNLQVSGSGSFEAFDIFYPLLFPSQDGHLVLKVRKDTSEKTKEIRVKPLSTAARTVLIEKRYGPLPGTVDELWEFTHINSDTAYLRLGTFVTRGMEMSWSKFLRASFDELKERKTPNLIIDIRGNEGGDDAVYQYLLRKLATESLEPSTVRELMRYDHVSDELRPFLTTWDQSFYDRREQVKPADSGFFTWKRQSTSNRPIQPSRQPYRGRTFALIDASNSSGTFLFAQIAKANSLATLVGQTTGGSQRGINGGQMFFLRLPNSAIAIDVPLIGYYPVQEMPDSGVEPHVHVNRDAQSVFDGTDLELEAALELIGSGR
jgi:hypothetical protein